MFVWDHHIQLLFLYIHPYSKLPLVDSYFDPACPGVYFIQQALHTDMARGILGDE
jgi:membrane associated rhomboid family serine protease